MGSKLRAFLELIQFEHTLFALPFAYGGMLLAAGGWPGGRIFMWVTVAMVAARTAGMLANRWIDRRLDAVNPRTAQRPHVRGQITPALILGGLGLSVAVLGVAAWQLNPACLTWAPVAVAILMIYPYLKRWTVWCHAGVGLALACAPMGGWMSVRAQWDPAAYLLGLSVLFWVAGFDLLYACQDIEFDRRHGVFSFPARYGEVAAFRLSEILHAGTLVTLVIVGSWIGLGPAYGWVIAAIAGLLVWEHVLLIRQGMSKINAAFFQTNAWISIIWLAGVICAL